MCGICGIVSIGSRPVDPGPIQAMLRRMAHRGPDSDGTCERPGIVAGIRRLAVIDVAGGGQPIHNEDGNVSVVFNGEIYNYREIRTRLEERGHRFSTSSDTEVLVHLWEDHGPQMVDKLNGMFAFCIHDRRTRETFLARDRVGIKPLYYHVDGDRLIFASELAVLLEHPSVPARVDHDALVELFLLQYLHGDLTIYESVNKLLPGHFLQIKNGALDVQRYYRMPAASTATRGSLREKAEELRALLERAVVARTVSDVPLGMFLSGGIDSSIIATLLANSSSAPIKTFSVGFEEQAAFDERRFARLVAERLGAEHHELVVSAQQIGAHLPQLVEHLREPVVDPAMVPTWILSRFARREVTVVLAGEGADELFGGYRRYVHQRRFGHLRYPASASARVLGGLGLASRLPGRLEQALEALAVRGPVSRHLAWASTVSRATAASLFGEQTVARIHDRVGTAFERYFEPGGAAIDGPLRADLAEWLPHNLLHKVDRSSMAFSLEARVPFLDHNVVDWAAALPPSMKIDGSTTKRVLREAFARDLPAEIVRRPKRGFDLPLAAWIRGPLRPLVEELFTDRTINKWTALDAEVASSMLARHLEGRADFGLPLFNLLSILIFLEREG